MNIRTLSSNEKTAFAQELRPARAVALKNAEEFDELLFALERLGSYLTRSHRGLGRYKDALRKIAFESALAQQAADCNRTMHLNFDALYDSVQNGRNDALHQGTVARQLANHAQELALIMEDALMNGTKTVLDFMVREPVCAELWYPLSSIRRTMLLNAFSYLPFRPASARKWRLISDFSVAAFLRAADKSVRDERLLLTLEEAMAKGLMGTKPMTCGPDDQLNKLIPNLRQVPCLVLDEKDHLCGIITAFDLL